MQKKVSYSKKDLLDIAEGVLRRDKQGTVVKPPMLMIDRILKITEDGGKYGKGSILTEVRISGST